MVTSKPGLQVSLSLEDLEKLERLTNEESGLQRRQAQIIILAGKGQSIDEITNAVQLPKMQVRHWLKEYRARGLESFPTRITDGPARNGRRPHPRQPPTSRPLPVPLTDHPHIFLNDPMSEAGRKIMAHYFARMLAEEDGVRQGLHTESIHDMRVVTRRLRSALRTITPYYRPRVLKPYRKILRSLAHALGMVRDLDVLRLKTEAYLAGQPEENRQGLKPLLDGWQMQFDMARQQLIGILDSRRFKAFVADFAAFVSTPAKGVAHIKQLDASTPYLVRHALPRLIYGRYAIVRIYETVLPDVSLNRLHSLRIDTKSFRYLLESFEEVLEAEGKSVSDAAKSLQDLLGDLQDARVAVNAVQAFLQKNDETFTTVNIIQYQAAREDEKQRLLAEVPKQWEAFTSPDLRRALARSISAL